MSRTSRQRICAFEQRVIVNSVPLTLAVLRQQRKLGLAPGSRFGIAGIRARVRFSLMTVFVVSRYTRRVNSRINCAARSTPPALA